MLRIFRRLFPIALPIFRSIVTSRLLTPALSALSLLVLTSVSTAEDVVHPTCHIRVRALSAGAATDAATAKSTAKSQEIDAPDGVADMKPQLRSLPYRSYEEVTTAEGTADIRTSKLFTFEDKNHATHRVTISPQGLTPTADGKPKVSFTINWRGPGNAEYLHTKLGFENGKNMLLGAEQGTGSPLVLCVTVRCDEPGL